MKFCMYIILLSFMVCSCTNTVEQETKKPAPTETQKPVVKAEPTNPNIKKVTYTNATVYAASTSYYFTDQEGRDFEVKVSTIPGEETLKIPEGLLESGLTEGPPEVNISMIGKPFEIRYNGRGKIISVEKLNGTSEEKNSIQIGVFSEIPEDYSNCVYAKSKNSKPVFVENLNGDAQIILAGKTIQLFFNPKIEGYSGEGFTVLKEVETTHSEHEYIEEAGELIIKSKEEIIAKIKVIGSCGV